MIIAINTSDAIGAVRESLRASLIAVGHTLPEPAMAELLELAARNAVQALHGVQVPEAAPPPSELIRPCVWCGYSHRFTSDQDDRTRCPNCGAEMSPVATRVFL